MAVRCDASGDRCGRNDAPTGDFTIQFAVRNSALNQSYDVPFWMGPSVGSGTMYNQGVGIFWGQNQNEIEIWALDSGGPRFYVGQGGGLFVANTWFHIALTGNTAQGSTLRCLVNGVFNNSGTSGAAGTFAANRLEFGNDSNLDNNVNGRHAYGVVHNAILSDERIRAGMMDFLYNAAGAWGAWSLSDDTTGGGLRDVTGNGRNLTETNTLTVEPSDCRWTYDSVLTCPDDGFAGPVGGGGSTESREAYGWFASHMRAEPAPIAALAGVAHATSHSAVPSAAVAAAAAVAHSVGVAQAVAAELHVRAGLAASASWAGAGPVEIHVRDAMAHGAASATAAPAAIATGVGQAYSAGSAWAAAAPIHALAGFSFSVALATGDSSASNVVSATAFAAASIFASAGTAAIASAPGIAHASSSASAPPSAIHAAAGVSMAVTFALGSTASATVISAAGIAAACGWGSGAAAAIAAAAGHAHATSWSTGAGSSIAAGTAFAAGASHAAGGPASIVSASGIAAAVFWGEVRETVDGYAVDLVMVPVEEIFVRVVQTPTLN